MKVKIVLILILFNFITSCSNEETDTSISFTNISKNALGGNGLEGISSSNLVIKTNTEWEDLISQVNTLENFSENFSEISIDFNEYMLIAVFLEVKTYGSEVEITQIIETTSELIVSAQETENPVITNVITQPFHIVKVIKSDKSVVFE